MIKTLNFLNSAILFIWHCTEWKLHVFFFFFFFFCIGEDIVEILDTKTFSNKAYSPKSVCLNLNDIVYYIYCKIIQNQQFVYGGFRNFGLLRFHCIWRKFQYPNYTANESIRHQEVLTLSPRNRPYPWQVLSWHHFVNKKHRHFLI